MPSVPFTDIYPLGPGAVGADGRAIAAGGNDLYPGMPAGANPISRDVTITAAGTVTIWTPASDRTIVLASAFLSTDTAMRIAIVDGADIQGQRPVDGYFGANGGASPNLIPVPYVSKLPGQALKVVTSALGNVKVRVTGWEQ